MNNFQPYKFDIEKLDLESEYDSDYVFSSIRKQTTGITTTGCHIDISVNIGYLEYYALPYDEIEKLTRKFNDRITLAIENDYIRNSVISCENHMIDKFPEPHYIGALYEFIDGLFGYRNNYNGNPDHIEYKSYTEQIKTALDRFELFLDHMTDVYNDLKMNV